MSLNRQRRSPEYWADLWDLTGRYSPKIHLFPDGFYFLTVKFYCTPQSSLLTPQSSPILSHFQSAFDLSGGPAQLAVTSTLVPPNFMPLSPSLLAPFVLFLPFNERLLIHLIMSQA